MDKFLAGRTNPFFDLVAIDGLRKIFIAYAVSGTPTFVFVLRFAITATYRVLVTSPSCSGSTNPDRTICLQPTAFSLKASGPETSSGPILVTPLGVR